MVVIAPETVQAVACNALVKSRCSKNTKKCIQKNPRIYSQINAYEEGKIKLEKYLALYQKH